MQSPICACSPCRRSALHRTLLCGRGGLRGWWHRHRDHPIGQQHRLLALQGIDGIEGVRIRGEDLIQSFPQILQHMKAVRDLDGCGCALACTLRIRTRPIPGDDLHPRDVPGATGRQSQRYDPAGVPRASGAPGPPGSCHRCAVSAGRNRLPRAPGVWAAGSGSFRSRRRRVFRLTTRSHWWPSCTPGCPPVATPRAPKDGPAAGAPGLGGGHCRQPR